MKSKLIGTWESVSSENFDEYMKELGVNFLLRKAALAITPTIIIAASDETAGDVKKCLWSFKMRSTLKNHDIEFKIGVEFDEVTPDGRKTKTTMILDGEDRLICEQRDPKTGQIVTSIIREIKDDDENVLVETLKTKNTVAKRNFKRIN